MEISKRFNDLGFDGSSKRLGIMGGTFDPIHIGHLACAEQAREAFGLDAVIFIPTGNPVFKQDQDVTPAADRYAMCRLACEPNPHFDVSAMEINRPGLTYAVDTCRILREHYPDNVELFFITGADSILSIAQWHESAEMASYVTFIAATRPGYVVTDDFKMELASAGPYKVEYFEVTSLAVSSSDCRKRVAEGFSLRYLTTLAVCDYIHRHGLYRYDGSSEAERIAAFRKKWAEEEVFFSGGDSKSDVIEAAGEEQKAASLEGQAVNPTLTQTFYDARHNDLESRVSPRRLAHIEGVAATSELLAKAYGVNPAYARLAGLLHDWDKGYDDEGIRERVAALGLTDALNPETVEKMPQVLHGPTAATALSQAYPGIPEEVIQAIWRHTTGAKDMSPLDMIIYIADAIEPNRHDPRVEEFRGMIGEVPLEDFFFKIYEYWTLRLIERSMMLHPDTISIWNEYAARFRARKDAARGKGNN